MKSLIHKAKYFRSTGSKVLIGIIFASTLSVLSISSALADRDDHGGWGNRGDHDDGWRRDRDDDRDDWRGDRDGYRNGYGYDGYGRYQQGYPQPYGYAQPVYVPPSVYYLPQQSPGINLIFPLNIRR
jgi:hypothetical protein